MPCELIRITDPADMPACGALPPLPHDTSAADRPDAIWVAVDDAGEAVARCATWADSLPALEGAKAGALGWFEAVSPLAAAAVLDAACSELSEAGCGSAVGPLDGTTWHRYRFVTERGAHPPFFMEPEDPDEYVGYFTTSGFSPLATYYSAFGEDLRGHDPRLDRAGTRLADLGVFIEPLDIGDAEAAVRVVHSVSADAFSEAFLYTPTTFENLLAQYRPILPYLDPRLLWVARLRGEPVGYVFAVPDLAQRSRGSEVDTVIIKTVAVLRDRRLAGLGALLVERAQHAAADAGYRNVIHALMHESNSSRNVSRHYAEPFRRYTLYSKALDR